MYADHHRVCNQRSVCTSDVTAIFNLNIVTCLTIISFQAT